MARGPRKPSFPCFLNSSVGDRVKQRRLLQEEQEKRIKEREQSRNITHGDRLRGCLQEDETIKEGKRTKRKTSQKPMHSGRHHKTNVHNNSIEIETSDSSDDDRIIDHGEERAEEQGSHQKFHINNNGNKKKTSDSSEDDDVICLGIRRAEEEDRPYGSKKMDNNAGTSGYAYMGDDEDDNNANKKETSEREDLGFQDLGEEPDIDQDTSSSFAAPSSDGNDSSYEEQIISLCKRILQSRGKRQRFSTSSKTEMFNHSDSDGDSFMSSSGDTETIDKDDEEFKLDNYDDSLDEESSESPLEEDHEEVIAKDQGVRASADRKVRSDEESSTDEVSESSSEECPKEDSRASEVRAVSCSNDCEKVRDIEGEIHGRFSADKMDIDDGSANEAEKGKSKARRRREKIREVRAGSCPNDSEKVDDIEGEIHGGFSADKMDIDDGAANEAEKEKSKARRRGEKIREVRAGSCSNDGEKVDGVEGEIHGGFSAGKINIDDGAANEAENGKSKARRREEKTIADYGFGEESSGKKSKKAQRRVPGKVNSQEKKACNRSNAKTDVDRSVPDKLIDTLNEGDVILRSKKKKATEDQNGPVRATCQNADAEKFKIPSVETIMEEDCSSKKNDNIDLGSYCLGEDIDEENEKLTKTMEANQPKRTNFDRFLVDSMLGMSGLPKQKVSEEEANKPDTLPWIFRFEFEIPKPKEKTDEELEIERLFAEADPCWYGETIIHGQTRVVDSPKTYEDMNMDAESPTVTDYLNACERGEHDLIRHEELGYVCRYCGEVRHEMKDIMPNFWRNGFRGLRKERFYEREKDTALEDSEKDTALKDNDFGPTGENFGESITDVAGTVWELKPGVKETMYQHQQEGLEFIWRNLEGTIQLSELKGPCSSGVGGCIISHAPGTGKTRLIIVFLETYLKKFPDARPLIIAPASILLTWEEEFSKWKVDFPFHNLNSLEFTKKESKRLLDRVSKYKRLSNNTKRLVKMHSWQEQKSVLGMSYNLSEKLIGEKCKKGRGGKNPKTRPEDEISLGTGKILLEHPQLVVLDEGHIPRNPNSFIWNTINKVKTEKKIILSGTPFQNNFGELFHTLHIVRPTVAKFLEKEKKISEKYKNAGGLSSSTWADSMIEKLKARMQPFVHIHKGSILQKSLPGLRDCIVLLNPPPVQKCLIKNLEHDNNCFKNDHKVALVSAHPSLLLNGQLSDKEMSGTNKAELERFKLDPNKGVKTKFVMELIRLSLSLKEKVLIFSLYIDPLRLIGDHLKTCFGWKHEEDFLLMRGKIQPELRQMYINTFNDSSSEAKVMLASTKCCSEGISLVGASRIVLLDVVWNPSVERQAISRAYRLGQKKIVHTYHLITSGTTEADKYCKQIEKDRVSELLFSATTKSTEGQKTLASAYKDNILEKMLDDDDLKGMFEKIIYHPKDINLIESFGLAS